MYTVRRRRRSSSPRGDYITECDYCGVCWPRHLLKMDRSGLLRCRDEGPGLSSTALSEGNAALANSGMRTPPRRGGRACKTNAFGPSQHLCDLDTSSPEVISLDPPDNSATVSLSRSVLELQFSKNMQRGIGNIYLYEEGVLVETIDVTSTAVLLAVDSVFVTISYALSSDSDYYVLIDSGALQDCNGLGWDGFDETDEWNWSTVDVVGPVLVSSTPTDNATDVCYNDDLQLVFNEPVQPATGTVYLKQSSDDAIVDSWDIAVDAVFTLNVVDLPLSGDLGSDTLYYLEVAAGVIEDTSGNSYAGLTKGELDFTTVDTTPEVYSTAGSPTSPVPSWATSAHLKMRGGGAASGAGGSAEPSGAGGGAAMVEAFIDVSGILELKLVVGAGGVKGSYGGSGCGGGGGGGGLSGAFSPSVTLANALAVASGGGGGGGGDNSGGGLPGANGGAGGATNGVAGANLGGANGGQGGTQATGGAGGSGTENSGAAGTALTGGAGANGAGVSPPDGAGGAGGAGGGGAGGIGHLNTGGGGGAGAGYYGGGGGGSSEMTDPEGGGAGGGGGSSFTSGWGENAYSGSGTTPGNTGDTDIGSGFGAGGAGVAATLPGVDGAGGIIWLQYGCEEEP